MLTSSFVFDVVVVSGGGGGGSAIALGAFVPDAVVLDDVTAVCSSLSLLMFL